MEKMYDVAIVGGGPVGSTMAYELASQGYKVAFIDKRMLTGITYDKGKPCGGLLDAHFFDWLPSGMNRKEARAAIVEHEAFKVRGRSQAHQDAVYESPKPVFSMGMRNRIDGYLAHEAIVAGATYICGKVDDIRDMGDCFLIHAGQTIGARYLVGADGAYSTVSRLTGVRPKVTQMIATEWEVDVDEDEMWEPWNQTILLDIVVKEMGYGWIIPKAKPHLSIGYLMPRRKAEQVKRITAQIKIDNNISGETTQTSHLIPFYHSGEVARGRVFLVGDAAGACNPANAAGISWGMLSGQMAVLAIVLDMDTSGNPGPQVYSRLFLKQLIGEYNTAKAMRNALLFDMSIRPFKAFDTTSTLDNFLQEAQADLHYDQWRADHPWRHRFGAMINPFIEKALIRSVS